MKKAGALGLLKLAPYGEGEAHRVMRSMILDMKERPRPRTLARLCEELQEGVKRALAANGYGEKDAVITYLPRLARKRRRAGTDQALELAAALSKATGIPCCTLLSRVGRGREQKTLNATQRVENLKHAFRLTGDVPNGKCVLLVDDLVTTGAGMSVATRLLRRAGAAGVLCICAAYTPRKK